MEKLGRFVMFAIGSFCYLVAAFIPLIMVYAGQLLPTVYSQGGPDFFAPTTLTGIFLFTLFGIFGTLAIVKASEEDKR